MNAEERFLDRFRGEFETGRLKSVKFFVRPNRMSVTDLFEELNEFEDSVVAGDTRIVESIDGAFQTTRFDAPFV